MARELNDLGFWLPAEFLTDDDVLTDFKSERFSDFACGFGNSRGFGSDLSSPGELAAENESEDDELVAELTRKLARSALLSDYSAKGWKVSGSPQSTPCGCKPGPTVSPNSVSGFCSPPEADDYLRRDFLYAAAEEVARMRLIEETAAFYSSKRFPPPQMNSGGGFHPNQARSQAHLSSQLLQAAKMRQQQQQQQMMMKSGDFAEFQLRNGRRNGGDGRAQAQNASMAAWPGLQQAGSGMRAIYLGESSPKKERTGTGVFLPQRFGSIPAETRKKSVCPTVLLPEKVVHALNIDVDSIDAHLQLHRSSSRDYGASNFDYDAAAAALKHRKNLMMAHQRRNLAPQAAMNHQLRLPRDWTY